VSIFRTKPIEQSIEETDEPERRLRKDLSALDLTALDLSALDLTAFGVPASAELGGMAGQGGRTRHHSS
jgi:APA family basic amino acid/polyamine antiporter